MGPAPTGASRISATTAPGTVPALVAAAAATERVRLGTFVLNAAFYNADVLARDVAATDALTGGRVADRPGRARRAADVPVRPSERVAEQLVAVRARHGISYDTVPSPFMEPFAEVTKLLRGA